MKQARKTVIYLFCALVALLCIWAIENPDLIRDPAYGFKFAAGVCESVLHNPRLAQRAYSTAIWLYSKNLPLHPTALMQAAAYNNRGWVRALTATTKEQCLRALADCNQAIALDGELVNSYDTRAYIYAKLGLYQNAIDDTETAIAQSADQVLNDWNGAVTDYPKDANSYALRGLVYLKLHQQEKANNDLSKAVELDPGCAAAKYFLYRQTQKQPGN